MRPRAVGAIAAMLPSPRDQRLLWGSCGATLSHKHHLAAYFAQGMAEKEEVASMRHALRSPGADAGFVLRPARLADDLARGRESLHVQRGA